MNVPGMRLTVFVVVPQNQKSKGWLIVTAALELAGNQVMHFYSLKKKGFTSALFGVRLPAGWIKAQA